MKKLEAKMKLGKYYSALKIIQLIRHEHLENCRQVNRKCTTLSKNEKISFTSRKLWSRNFQITNPKYQKHLKKNSKIISKVSSPIRPPWVAKFWNDIRTVLPSTLPTPVNVKLKTKCPKLIKGRDRRTRLVRRTKKPNQNFLWPQPLLEIIILMKTFQFKNSSISNRFINASIFIVFLVSPITFHHILDMNKSYGGENELRGSPVTKFFTSQCEAHRTVLLMWGVTRPISAW